MQMEATESRGIAAAIEALRQEVAKLSERLAALEAAASAVPAAPAAAEAEGINEETVLVLSAAIAAFLGKKASIRQIRLVGSSAWAQQGRVTIQASHNV